MIWLEAFCYVCLVVSALFVAFHAPGSDLEDDDRYVYEIAKVVCCLSLIASVLL